MDQEPGTPFAFVVVLLVGFAVLAVGVALGGATALELARGQGEQGRNLVIASSIQGWARLLIGCALLMLGLQSKQPAAVRGGSLIAAAVVITGGAG